MQISAFILYVCQLRMKNISTCKYMHTWRLVRCVTTSKRHRSNIFLYFPNYYKNSDTFNMTAFGFDNGAKPADERVARSVWSWGTLRHSRLSAGLNALVLPYFSKACKACCSRCLKHKSPVGLCLRNSEAILRR